MIVNMKCLNEEKNVELVVGDIHDEPWVDRIIVIDGGSTDSTVDELKRFDKVEVFIHKWYDTYPDMEVCQSNVQMSYVPVGETYFILDFDERCSDKLKELLNQVDQKGMPVVDGKQVDTVSLSRVSFDLMRYPNSPFAMKDKDGWWTIANQIGGYPDFQLRIIKRKLGMHWMNSPHHMLFGHNTLFTGVNLTADIIHYHGKEDLRDRVLIERKWAKAQIQRKRLGLKADKFEATLTPTMFECAREYEAKNG